MESDPNKRRGLFISIECINTLNEGLLLQHKANGCSKPSWSKYLSFLKSKKFAELTQPKFPTPATLQTQQESIKAEQKVFDEPGSNIRKFTPFFPQNVHHTLIGRL